MAHFKHNFEGQNVVAISYTAAKVLAGSGSLGLYDGRVNGLSGLTVSQLCQFLPDLKWL